MTPPTPPPPPPPNFFQSYHRAHHQQQRKSPCDHQNYHQPIGSPSCPTTSEFDSTKLQALTSMPAIKCTTLEYSKSKHHQPQQMAKYASNSELRRAGRPRSQPDHQKSKIYQQNHEAKYHNRYLSTTNLMQPKSSEYHHQSIDQTNNKSCLNKTDQQLSIFDGSKKSRCILFSQIYLITHVSITICLSQTRDIQTSFIGSSMTTISKDLMIDVYTLYILIVSLIFFLLLRYYAVPRLTDSLTFNELTEQTPILFGAIILGFSELAQCVMQLIDCLESESIIIPIVQFIFLIAFMHFLLTQIIYSDYIGLRNIALAHLLSTQISLWILSALKQPEHLQRQSRHYCDHKLDIGTLRKFLFNHNNSHNRLTQDDVLEYEDSTNYTGIAAVADLPEPFQISLFVLNNQFKFITVFILITMWFSNNQSKINFIRAKLSEEEVIRSAYLNPESKPYLYGGFMVGSVFLMTSMASIIFYDDRMIQYGASIFIQVMITIISLAGLIVRRRQINANDPKYQINILKHHFIIFVTLFLVYIVSLMNLTSFLTLLLTTHSDNSSPNTEKLLLPMLSAISYLTMIIQVTIQSYLLRLQGKKLVNMTHVFSLLTIANFALWIIDVSTIVSNQHLWPIQMNNMNDSNVFSIDMIDSEQNPFQLTPFNNSDNYLRNIFTMFVPLNRLYCSLIFFHFWKLKI